MILQKAKAATSCHDRLDIDDDTGLFPCNDGRQVKDWKECADATVKPVTPFPDDCDPVTDSNCESVHCPAVIGTDCKPSECKAGYKLVNGKCEKRNPEDIKIIFKTIIKNEETIKKIYNDNLGLKRTIVAINYDEGGSNQLCD